MRVRPPRAPSTPTWSRLLQVVAMVLGVGLALQPAHADPNQQRFGIGGYFRVGARPDFQGGDGRLGYWWLYGRLLNEGPYAMVDLRVDLAQASPGTTDPWATAHMRLEGGSVGGASPTDGSLATFRMSQLFVRTGNVLIPNVTWQIGTLDTWFGDLGLYDIRPSQLFYETVGLSGWYRKGIVDVMLGVGDSGFKIRGLNYSPIFTAGGYVGLRAGKKFQIGLGGQVLYEPAVLGSQNAPYATPGLDYEDWIRGEVLQRFEQENPGQADDFPDPEARSFVSGKAALYVGFGNMGPLRWNSLYASFRKVHPEIRTTERWQDEDYTLYVGDLTDERYELLIGNEMQLNVIRDRWDITWAAVYGEHWDEDNDLQPSDHDRWYASGVIRNQVYVTRVFHILLETSLAREFSKNGNAFRTRGDSIFQSTDGRADSRGLEFGDSDTRDTWQGKGGFVINPLGPGIYVRPSLRVLYGVQWSSQNNAFGNSFVDSLSELNDFGAWENRWHHMLSFEVEAWF